MKVELSKREIEVIIDLIAYGTTFLVSHGAQINDYIDKTKKEEIVNINELEERLKKKIGR